MKALLYLGLTVVLGSALACGKSPEQQPAEALRKAGAEMQKSADQMQKGAQDLAKGFEAMARGLGAAAGSAAGTAAAVEPVDFHVLEELLPEVSGWERRKPTGERITMPVAHSSAKAEFTNGSARVQVRIVDSGYHQILMTPLAFMLAAGYSKETDTGYEKATTVSGNPGFVKWNDNGKRGELTAVVNNRFVVEVTGRRLADVKDLQVFMDRTDLKRVAAVK